MNTQKLLIVVALIALAIIVTQKKEISIGVCSTYQCSDYVDDFWVYKDSGKGIGEANSCCTANTPAQVDICKSTGYTTLYLDCSCGSCNGNDAVEDTGFDYMLIVYIVGGLVLLMVLFKFMGGKKK